MVTRGAAVGSRLGECNERTSVAAYKLTRILYRMLKYGAGNIDQEPTKRVTVIGCCITLSGAAELGIQVAAIKLSTGQPALT